MGYYIYQGDLYCDDCGQSIIYDLSAGRDDVGFTSDDSNEFPQYHYEISESDCPQHCAGGSECPNGLDGHGMFFENPLTPEGRKYVVDKFRQDPTSKVVQEWVNYYEYREIEDDPFIRGWLGYFGGDELPDNPYAQSNDFAEWSDGWKVAQSSDVAND